MKLIFADTFYWIASIHPGDDWYQKARNITANLDQIKIVTTDEVEVFVEVLNFCSTRGSQMRQQAIQLLKGVMGNPKIQVIEQTHESFLSGSSLYERRSDKGLV